MSDHGRHLPGNRKPALMKAAVRSSLRRYPKSLLECLQERPAAHMPRIADRWIAAHAQHPAPETPRLQDIARHRFAASWLGHGSVVLRAGGATLIVDPVLSERVGPRIAGRTFGPRRLTPAPARPEDLPAVDLVLITHAHFDHLDRETLRRMRSPGAVVVTPRGVRDLIPAGFARVVELEPGREIDIAGVMLTAVTPRHWGARAFWDRKRGVNSYVVRVNGTRALLAGDTAMTDAFERVGAVDLAAFGIGAYNPWEHMHATPEQVWTMFTRMGGRRLLPIHHSTFELSDEHVEEPMTRLLAAAAAERERVLALRSGEVWVDGGGA